MPLDSIRETVSTLRESREAIHDGRIALAEAKVDLQARYDRAKRRIDRVAALSTCFGGTVRIPTSGNCSIRSTASTGRPNVRSVPDNPDRNS